MKENFCTVQMVKLDDSYVTEDDLRRLHTKGTAFWYGTTEDGVLLWVPECQEVFQDEVQTAIGQGMSPYFLYLVHYLHFEDAEYVCLEPGGGWADGLTKALPDKKGGEEA